MGNLIPLPPPGQPFVIPTRESVPNLPAQQPLLPIVKSRLVEHPEHFERVRESLPESHKAKQSPDVNSAMMRLSHYGNLIKNWKDSVVPRFVAAAGFGGSGIGILSDLLFSSSMGHAPAAILMGMGLTTGLWGLGRMTVLGRERSQVLLADAQLEKSVSRGKPLATGKLQASTPVIAKNVMLPNDPELRAKIDAALNIQLPDVAAINAILPEWAQLVHIAGAVFIMGNDGSVRSDEGPAFTAVVSPFHVMEAAVSNAAFREFESSHNSDMRSQGFNDDDQPAVEVTLDKAKACAAWMNERYPVKGMKWRLQREAEKDRIMRDGDLDTVIDAPSQDRVNWGGKNKTLKVKDPKYRDKNGVYHGRGNIWEWCEDKYGKYLTGIVINHRGVENSSTFVLRGASWYSGVNYVRLAFRDLVTADAHLNLVGLRFVLAPEDS